MNLNQAMNFSYGDRVYRLRGLSCIRWTLAVATIGIRRVI